MSQIDIHPASEAERLALYRNVHEVWGNGLSMDDFLQWRLASPQHQRARWWALTLDGQVVASLGCHRLTFRQHDGLVPGYGFAAVHTRPEHRRKGLADRLCRAVIEHEEAQGARFGLLFSDIRPDYYAQMGFVACGHTRWTCADPETLASSGRAATLRPMDDPLEHLGELAAAWETWNADRPLSLARDEDHWRYSIRKNRDIAFWRVEGDQGEALGYVRLWEGDSGGQQTCVPVELGLHRPDEATHAALWRALGARAMDAQGVLSSWLHPARPVAEHFCAAHRDKAITMIRPSPGVAHDLAWMRRACVVPPTEHF